MRAADEGRPRLDAAVAHALDDVGDPLRHVFAAGDIIEEKQGLGPAADDVVDAHGHAVHAHGVVLVHEKGQLQLGAHPVGAGDQHRLGHAGQVRHEQAAEAADVGADALRGGAGDMALHQLHGPVPGGDVHARRGVGFGPRISDHPLLLSVPAVGAKVTRIKSDCFDYIIKRLKIKG